MKASGNGAPEQCALNLMRISRGEVPYERLKGVNSALIDAPIGTADNEASADVEWLLGAFEPRINIDNISVASLIAAAGDLKINAQVRIRKERDNNE